MTTYYVSKSGNDNNPGTESQPWLTIQKAENSIVAGDIVLIQRGTYNEFLKLYTSGLSNTARCIFSSYPGDERLVIVDGSSKNPSNGLVDVQANYITFQNIKVQNNTTADGVNTSGTGIYAGAYHDITISNCLTYNTAGLGIEGHGSSSILIDSNELILAANGNFTECLDIINCNGFEVKNNYVHDGGNGYGGSPVNNLQGGEGIDIYQSQNGIVHHNIVSNTKYVGIYLDGAAALNQNIEVNSNIVHDIRYGPQVAIATEKSTGHTNNISYYNNIIYNQLQSDVSPFSVDGSTGNISNLQIINNTIDGSIWVGGPNLSGITIRNNVYSLISTDIPGVITKSNNWEMYSQGTSGLFVNYAGHDYHLFAGSKLIDIGTSNGAPSFDIDNNPRPQGAGFDIGAYEYTSIAALSSILISPTIATIRIDKTKQLTATCKDQYGNVISCPVLIWKSSNVRIATVNSTGLVKGISRRTANITTSAFGIISNISVITII